MNNQELRFLNQLNESEILSLINLSIINFNAQNESPVKERAVDYISIYAEEDRRDPKGNRYMYVTTASQGNFVGLPYSITDFTMTRLDLMSPRFSIDFSDTVKAYMTKKFGQEYIEALHNLRVQEADAESQILQQYLSSTRK